MSAGKFIAGFIVGGIVGAVIAITNKKKKRSTETDATSTTMRSETQSALIIPSHEIVINRHEKIT